MMNEGTALMVPPELSLSRPTLPTGRSQPALQSQPRKRSTPPTPFSESSATPDNALKGIAALEGFLEWR